MASSDEEVAATGDPTKEKKKKSKDKKEKKEKKESGAKEKDKKKKKTSKKSTDDVEGGEGSESQSHSAVGGGDADDVLNSPTTSETKKKKKKTKKSSTDAGNDGEDDDVLMTPETTKKKKKKGSIDPSAYGAPSADSLLDAFSPAGKKKLSEIPKYSVEYFDAILAEVREKCDKKIKIKSKDRDAFLEACHHYYDAWYGKVENEQWLNDLLEKNASQAEIDEAQAYVDESNEALPKMKRYAIRMAMKIFDSLDEERMASLEDKLVKGAIIAQASPQKLAEFAAEGKENEKLIKSLFARPKLMKDMLRFGGAVKYEYGKAMKIYTECIGEDDDDDDKPMLDDDDSEYDEIEAIELAWKSINKKIALACALELASPMYEFDTTNPIDPVARYKHFEKAHRKGELDPAFPFFSVWEMRQIVNCDAPNDQMEWCRKMLMNYVRQ